MKFGDHCLVLIRNLTSVISGLKMDFSQLKSWAYMMMSCFTFFFVCISHLLFISLTPWHSPDPFLLSSPYLALISFLLTPIILSPALVPVLCLFFGPFAYLHVSTALTC